MKSQSHGSPQANAFEPTFTGGRQERRWIKESLGDFYEDDWFTDVLYRVKGGKEATVYCCAAHPSTGLDLLAAKVFRPRQFRAMKNDAHYKLGRGLLDASGKAVFKSRPLRALVKRTRYGKRLDMTSWCRHEYKVLQECHEAGADVPKPLICSHNAILMEYVGDRDGAAPILHSVSLGADEAQVLFDQLIENVEIMLSLYRIHGDLSAYNVLYWDGDVRLIDFPQTVDAMGHPDAFSLFARDVDRLCRYFTKQGLDCDAAGIAQEMWARRLG